MTTRVTQFFAERCELTPFLVELKEKENLFLYVARSGTLEPLATSPDPEERRVFIGTTLEGEEALKGGTDAPGKWGLVLLNFPFQREGVLTMTTLSSRTDWSEDGKRRQLATAGQLHKKIEFLLRRHLRFSIWACNLKTKKCEEYSDVGYTKNVEIFAKKGGKLKQEGVANIEFFLTRP